MAIELREEKIELTVADRQFVQLIDNMITAYGEIPYTVPTKLIIAVIKDSARLFFHYHLTATRRAFYRITVADIMEFAKNYDSNVIGEVGYFVYLPTNIQVVRDIYETDKPASVVPKDVSEYSRTSTVGQQGINVDMYRIEGVVKTVEEAAVNTVSSDSVPFTFSKLDNHRLSIGKKLEQNIILDVLCNVDIQSLYNDGLFIRHVIGCTKRELKRIIGGHTKPLPGGVTLNVDEICNNLEDIGTVESIIKSGSIMGDVILTND